MYNPAPIPSILRTCKTTTGFINVLRLIGPSSFVFKQPLQFMIQQYQCFLTKTILEKWWKLLRAWQWKGNCWAILEYFKHWRTTTIDLSFYKGLANFSFPLVKLLLSSNQVKHISLFYACLPWKYSNFVSLRLEDTLLSEFHYS